MDDEIAGRQVVYLGDELVEAAPAPCGPRQSVAEDVLLAEQHELRCREALLERQYREPDRRQRQLCEAIAVGDSPQVGDTALAQHAENSLGGTLAEGGNWRTLSCL